LRGRFAAAAIQTRELDCFASLAMTVPYPYLSSKRIGMEQMAQETAVLAGGCFWCTEAVFLQLDGVESVESGYTGGQTVNPTYCQVCVGDTGHAEAIRITFDPGVISYADLLDVFFATHDPTQLNRQGNDIGTQYRSAIFPQDEAQDEAAREGIRRAQADHLQPIVTTIEPAAEWYPAEDYHQDYWAGEGQSNAYCLAVIPPKLAKLRKKFAEQLSEPARQPS
jgi:peptide-methionine (S)-S-oxide reductase